MRYCGGGGRRDPRFNPVHVDRHRSFHQTLDTGALLVGQAGRGRWRRLAAGHNGIHGVYDAFATVVVVVSAHLHEYCHVIGGWRRRRLRLLLYRRRNAGCGRLLLLGGRCLAGGGRRHGLVDVLATVGRRRFAKYGRRMVAEHVRQPAHAPPDTLPQHFCDSTSDGQTHTHAHTYKFTYCPKKYPFSELSNGYLVTNSTTTDTTAGTRAQA